MNRSLILVSALAMLALSACDSRSTEPESQASASEPERVVARVNGTPIGAAMLDAQIQAQAARGQPVQRAKALDELIDLVVLAQAAEQQGYAKQPEIAAEIQRQRAGILARRLVRSQLSSTEVTEDDLRQAYEKRVAALGGQEYRASHILLETEEKAQSLIAKLDEGADFAKLAKEHSTGPTGSRGGDLGWFGLDQMVEPFSQAVAALDVGTYTTEPVKTRYGWHVIQLADVREREKPAFEQMKARLRSQLVGQNVRAYIDSLREDAQVEIVDAGTPENAGASEAASSGSTPASAESDAPSTEKSSAETSSAENSDS